VRAVVAADLGELGIVAQVVVAVWQREPAVGDHDDVAIRVLLVDRDTEVDRCR
jgi:hypothetical protein